ncbi:DUF459 domain-containing protein [Rhizobium sp. RU20A]|uniref:SGNH/GDSL hydrolase family protein n=1 Tax=Rhizobium sp. RU20A TaxID=1907412 RepID=UPI001FCEC222|nr:DUF459 domain-containing protein [Rhizobium sp. RU20A]
MRSLLRALLAFICLSLGFTIADTAGAQERRRTLFDMFFGRERIEQAPRRFDAGRGADAFPERPDARPQRKRRPAAAAAGNAVPKAAPAAEKAADAKKVLVIGDFIAAGLGDGLKEAFAQAPDIVIETRANTASGLVRDDYYNWPEKLASAIAQVKPDAVVIMIGANDRQQIRLANGTREKFRTDAWLAEYERRVSAFAAIGRQTGAPLIWVGMPPFQTSSMMADMASFNTLYREATETVKGDFIDIWDGFVDADGKFMVTGPDLNGQQVRLRGSDGINMTRAGKRKMAFYVEKDIRRILGVGIDPGLPQATEQGPTDLKPTLAPPSEITRTPPIALTDPALDGGDTLLGAGPTPVAADKSPIARLLEGGETGEAPNGRVDDFRLAKPANVISNPVIRN